MKTKITIEKDGAGYLAKVSNHHNLFAFAYSEKEALMELKNVVELILAGKKRLPLWGQRDEKETTRHAPKPAPTKGEGRARVALQIKNK